MPPTQRQITRITPRLKAIACRYGGSSDQSDEVFQEMIVSILEGTGRGHTDSYIAQAGKFQAQKWLSRDLINCRMVYESEFPRNAGDDETDIDGDNPLLDTLSYQGAGRPVEDQTIAEDIRDRIIDITEHLNKKQRIVIYLLLRGRTITEIGAALGETKQTIRIRLNRLRGAFMDLIDRE